jgi:hypothetical protein
MRLARGRAPKSRVRLAIVCISVAAAFGSATVAEANVRIGAPGFVPGGNISACVIAPCAFTLSAVPGGHAVSPVNGTIVSWGVGVIPNGGGPVAMARPRVVRPAGAGALFLRTGATESLPSPGEQTFPASLPIGIGERFALELLQADQGVQAQPAQGYAWQFWRPSPADGATEPPDQAGTGEVMEFFADVEPTNTLTLPTVVNNRRNGTAQLTVSAPNPGQLMASSAPTSSGAATSAKKKKRKRTKAGPLVVATSTAVAAPGRVTMTLSPTKPARKRLKRKGRAAGTVVLNFTPSFGTMSTKTLAITLTKKRAKRKRK